MGTTLPSGEREGKDLDPDALAFIKAKRKVDDLQKELNGYIKTDAGKVQSALDNNTQALRDLREIIIMSKKWKKLHTYI